MPIMQLSNLQFPPHFRIRAWDRQRQC